jgi:histidinol-phosphate aminotransferase
MTRAKQVIRPDVQAMHAYHVSDASGFVKLDVMESPFRLPDWLAKEVGEVVANLELNRYPVPTALKLRALIKDVMQVPAGCEVLLGTGSDECIQYITAAVAREGAVVMAPAPSFAMFQLYAQFYRLPFIGVPLNPDFTLDVERFLAAMVEHKPALVWIAFPNNPTGNPFAVADIERIIRAAPGLVVIDEAYQPFAGTTFMPRITEFDNLVVLRTVSKIGMAGVRLGYVAGHPEWINEFDKTRSPFNVSVLSEAVAIKLLENKAVLDEQAAIVRAERDRLVAQLAGVQGVTQFPSAANFVLVRIEGGAGAGTRVFDAMKRQGVLVKNFSGGHPMLDNCLRLTVGTPDENRAMLAALKTALS